MVMIVTMMMVVMVAAPMAGPIIIATAQRQAHGKQPGGDDHFRNAHHRSPLRCSY